MNSASQICQVFNACFLASYHTRLEGGGDEPVYLPGDETVPHRIIFRADYERSALHEVAHWCHAGHARRQQMDYGYWYQPARDAEAQAAFEQAEARPQAIERVLCLAAGIRFQVSIDNFDDAAIDPARFRTLVGHETLRLLEGGLNPRIRQFALALCRQMPAGDASFDNPDNYQTPPD
ncbi:MAG: elongation factor P hydroxylase [Pseudomonadales bacterium]|nr:elongation factor P hydroxylase [Pseudomonadales bacterium]